MGPLKTMLDVLWAAVELQATNVPVTIQCTVGTFSGVVYTMMAMFQDVTDMVILLDGLMLLT